MKNKKQRLIDLYANTRFSIGNLALLDLFERSSEGKSGLEVSLLHILSNPQRAGLYEHSLRIDAGILVRNDTTEDYSEQDVQEEITAFIQDLRRLMKQYNHLFLNGKLLYIGLEKPNTVVIGVVRKEDE